MIFHRVVMNPHDHFLVDGIVCHNAESGDHKVNLGYRPPAVMHDPGLYLRRNRNGFHDAPACNRQGAVHYAFVIS